LLANNQLSLVSVYEKVDNHHLVPSSRKNEDDILLATPITKRTRRAHVVAVGTRSSDYNRRY